MEFESWWLLAIPLFFGLGWFASRLEGRAHPPDRALPDAYFKGLNFLLNEKPDQAIDAFVDVVRLDPDTVELHFALGNLFRRRGETDRAIRVHQNLADRGDLGAAQRQHALYELGQDFLKAGLLDRAEDVFNRLEGSEYAGAALKLRLEIAQQVLDWPQAIELAARLARDTGAVLDREIGHFHCEIAQRALAGGDADRFEVAQREVQAALRADADHPRAWLMHGQLESAQGRPDAAIDAWRELAARSPSHLALVAEGWIAAHREIGRLSDGLDELERHTREQPSIDALRAAAQARAGQGDRAQAARWLEERVAGAPSLLGLEALIELRRDQADADAPARELTRRLIEPQARRLARYVCDHCGFKARQFQWRCPGCSRWETYAPRRGEELGRE